MHDVHLFFLAMEAPKALGDPVVRARTVWIRTLGCLQRRTTPIAKGGHIGQSFSVFPSAPFSRAFLAIRPH
jgi:hypothetical protein